MKRLAATKAKKSKRFTEEDRIAFLCAIRDGEYTMREIEKKRVFMDCNGKKASLSMLRDKLWSFAKKGDLAADYILEAGSAVVLDRAILNHVGYEGPEEKFFDWLLRGRDDKWYFPKQRNYRPFTALKKGVDTSITPIPKKDWTDFEKRLCKSCENEFGPHWQDKRTGTLGRRFRISSTGPGVAASTDGVSTVWFSRQYLRRINASALPNHARKEIIHLTIHELAHDESSSEHDLHDGEFYERYHHLMRGNLAALFRVLRALEKAKDKTVADRERERAKQHGVAVQPDFEQEFDEPQPVAASPPQALKTKPVKVRRKPVQTDPVEDL
jgi:hypothetical protein